MAPWKSRVSLCMGQVREHSEAYFQIRNISLLGKLWEQVKQVHLLEMATVRPWRESWCCLICDRICSSFYWRKTFYKTSKFCYSGNVTEQLLATIANLDSKKYTNVQHKVLHTMWVLQWRSWMSGKEVLSKTSFFRATKTAFRTLQLTFCGD